MDIFYDLFDLRSRRMFLRQSAFWLPVAIASEKMSGKSICQLLCVDSRKVCGAILDFGTKSQAKLSQQRVLDDLLLSETVERVVQGKRFCHLSKQGGVQIH